VVADKSDSGIKIGMSKLKVVAYGLKGIEASQFSQVAADAEKACPVSNAYRGSLEITLDASVG
jgi:organic hydroperoxide reductase OsmC/OhrA